MLIGVWLSLKKTVIEEFNVEDKPEVQKNSQVDARYVGIDKQSNDIKLEVTKRL